MIRVRQIKVAVERDSEENLIKAVCKKIRISKEDILELNIYKQSIDARNKNSIFYVYEVNVKLKKMFLFLQVLIISLIRQAIKS